jgi:hypothetical protein
MKCGWGSNTFHSVPSAAEVQRIRGDNECRLGEISTHLEPILERLGLSGGSVVRLATEFGNLFHRVVGSGPTQRGFVRSVDLIDRNKGGMLATHSKAAIAKLAQDKVLLDRIRGNGLPWRGVVESLENALPDILDDRIKIAYDLVREFMNKAIGVGKWQTERRQSKSTSGMTNWVVVNK